MFKKFVVFSRKVDFDAAFGNIMVVTKEADEISGFSVIIEFDLHSNSTIVGLHL